MKPVWPLAAMVREGTIERDGLTIRFAGKSADV